MRTIWLRWAALLFVVPTLLGSFAEAQTRASDTPRRGGTLRVALYNEPTTLDPATTTNVPSIRVRNQIYETLLAWDKSTGLQPMLADSYEVNPEGNTDTARNTRCSASSRSW